jgi:predicted PolB exonuclease-like 3'-5' exonuclease
MYPFHNVLIVDVETVPIVPTFDQLSEPLQVHWSRKSAQWQPDLPLEPAQTWERAGIYAEFGKIICISTGILTGNEIAPILHVRSFNGPEDELLRAFFAFCLELQPERLAGHNIREFDIPYICRRSFIQQVPLPPLLAHMQAKKPWESPLIDTLQFWKFGEFKNFVSVDLLCTLLGIDSPKQTMSGQDVAQMYWQERNRQRIIDYCEHDVLAVAHILLRLMGTQTMNKSNITIERHERNKRYHTID